MSKMTWPTPGPWRIEKNNKAKTPEEYGFIYKPKKVNSVVIKKIILSDLTNVRGRSVNEAKANERLIAAAPDLLYGALKILSSFKNDNTTNEEQELAIKKLEKAVKKVINWNWYIHTPTSFIDNWKKDAYAPTEKEIIIEWNIK